MNQALLACMLSWALLCARVTAESCNLKCNDGLACAKSGIFEYCVATPTPKPDCVCTQRFNPACCEFSHQSWFGFTFKGKLANSNECDCACKGGKICATPPPSFSEEKPPMRICTMEYSPVCCEDKTTKKKSTKGNKCECGSNNVVKEGPC